LKWFKHDSNANTDAKLKRVRMKYGMAGYGLYWYCLELIAAGVDKNKLNFELEHDAEIIAHDTGINYEVVQEMMSYFVDLNLFENSSGLITCMKMGSRTDEYIAKSLRTLSGHTPDKVPSNRIDKKRIEETNKRFKKPTIIEAAEHIAEKGYQFTAEEFIESNEAKGWVVGKSNAPMKCWKSAMSTWNRFRAKDDAKQSGDNWGGARI